MFVRRAVHSPRRLTALITIMPLALSLALHVTATSSRAGAFDCGQPKSKGEAPTAGDALIVLRSAVKLQSCDPCVCDVNDNDSIAAGDALLTLKVAVGQQVTLNCPPCTGNIVFVSSQTYTGNLGGLAGADAKCQALASAAGHDGTFLAWLSTDTVNAVDHVGGPPVAYKLVDGRIVTDSLDDLVFYGAPLIPIDLTESGTILGSNEEVWTGTDFDGIPCFHSIDGCAAHEPSTGLPVRNSCGNWTQSISESEAVVGRLWYEWSLFNNRSCTSLKHLYCFQPYLVCIPEACPTHSVCRVPICTGEPAKCDTAPAATGTDCTTGGTPMVCADDTSEAAGTCVECNTADDCAGPEGDMYCASNHVCVFSPDDGYEQFRFDGAARPFVVPAGVTSVTISADGAWGGPNGGNGGFISATMAVTPGETLMVRVGNAGGEFDGQGFNGGGSGGGGGGGGASDVRQGGDSLADRIVVAGGGGGGSFVGAGGAGGGLVGSDGSGPDGIPGGGATQIAGGTGGGINDECHGSDGSLGAGGDGQLNSVSGCGLYGGGGGGGGYYGGGGGGGAGAGNITPGGGGGGSSYAAPSATDVSHEQGVIDGGGQVDFTWVIAD